MNYDKVIETLKKSDKIKKMLEYKEFRRIAEGITNEIPDYCEEVILSGERLESYERSLPCFYTDDQVKVIIDRIRDLGFSTYVTGESQNRIVSIDLRQVSRQVLGV